MSLRNTLSDFRPGVGSTRLTTGMQKAVQRRRRFLQNLRQNPRERIRQEYFGLLVHRGKLRAAAEK